MTMTNADTRFVTAGTGSLYDFGFTFPVESASDVAVYLRSSAGVITLQTISTHYTVALTNGGLSGGTVTMVTAPAVGEYLSVVLAPPRTQGRSYRYANVFPSKETENLGDKLTNIAKRLFDDELGRTLRMDPGGVVAASDPFEAQGKKIANLADPDAAQDAATKAFVQSEIINAVLGGAGYTVSPYMAGMFSEVSAADVLTYLTMSAYMQTGVTAANLSALTTARGYAANVRSLLLSANSDGMLTVLGFSTFIKTLINDTTAAEARTTLQVTADVARHNFLVNGDFQVWQHGTTIDGASTPANSDDTYVCDQWILLSDGNDRADITKLTTGLPDGVRSGMKLTAQSSGAERFGIFQPIEASVAQALRGKTVSLGFWGRSSGNLSEVTIALLEWTGTADAITSDVINAWQSGTALPATYATWTQNGATANIALSSSWSRGALLNRTVGASVNNLGVLIYVNDIGWNATDELDLSGVHLVAGAYDVPFRSAPFEEEFARAQRYFQKTFDPEDAPAQATYDAGLTVYMTPGAGPMIDWVFPVPMLASPTVTMFSVNGGTTTLWEKISGAGSGAATIASVVAVKSMRHAAIYGVDAGTGSNTYAIHATADARL